MAFAERRTGGQDKLLAAMGRVPPGAGAQTEVRP
jgi:hypothetical protein